MSAARREYVMAKAKVKGKPCAEEFLRPDYVAEFIRANEEKHGTSTLYACNTCLTELETPDGFFVCKHHGTNYA